MSDGTIDKPDVPEFIVFANARRICGQRYRRLPNWSLAMEVFGLGSTWAWALCERIGVDPDGKTALRSRAAMPKEADHEA